MPKKKELKNLTVRELENQLADLRKDLIKENAQVASGTTPKSPGALKALKKTIARIITLLKIKEVGKKQ